MTRTQWNKMLRKCDSSKQNAFIYGTRGHWPSEGPLWNERLQMEGFVIDRAYAPGLLMFIHLSQELLNFNLQDYYHIH